MSVPRVHASPEPTIGVLGGSGFVGRSVLRRLLEAGLAAVNIDRAASDPASPAAFRRADLTDRVSLEAAFAGCTEIINLAAEWRDDVRPVERYRAVNVDGTRNVVAALKANDIRKCIFTSSVSVYGPTTHPVDEDHPPAPINPYGRSKLEAERLLFDWAAEGQGVTLAVVRPTVIFGPGNRGNVWNLLNQMANGPFLMIGDGENRKSMAFVENVAAFLLFCRQLSPGVHVFNYADGPDLTMNELVRLVRARLGRDPRIGFRVPRPAALAGAKLFDLASAVLRRPFGVTSERVFKFCANTQYSPNRALQSGFVAPVRLDEALAATIDIEFGPVRSLTRWRPRVWIVSDLYYPEDVSTGYFATRIAESLAESADVEVLCGRPSYALPGVKVPRRELRNGTRIHRVPATAFPKDVIPLRAINVATFTISVCLICLLSLRRGDRILCLTNPPTVPSPLALIARLRGARFVLLLHDVFPETLAATGKVHRGGLLYRVLSAFSSLAYHMADHVVALGRDMAWLAQGKRGRAEGVEIIENWADLDELGPQPRDQNPLLARPELRHRRVAQVSGNIGRTHGVETILEAAALLGPDGGWQFLVAGFGGKLGLVEAAASCEGSNVTLLPRQPRGQLGVLLNACDVHVIAFVRGMTGLSVPSRMYNVMAVGKPIIAMAEQEHELARVVEEEDCGWRLDPGDARGLASLLRDGISDVDLQRKGRNGRAAAEARYRFDQKMDRFRRLLAG